MTGGERANDGRAPRPTDEGDATCAPALEDELGRAADVAEGDVCADDRRVLRGRTCHFRRLGRGAVSAHIDQPGVPSVRCDVVHPGSAVELQVEGRLASPAAAVHEEDDLRRVERSGVLVSQVQLDPGVGGRDPQFFADDRARRRVGNSSARASDRERKQEELAHAKLHGLETSRGSIAMSRWQCNEKAPGPSDGPGAGRRSSPRARSRS